MCSGLRKWRISSYTRMVAFNQTQTSPVKLRRSNSNSRSSTHVVVSSPSSTINNQCLSSSLRVAKQLASSWMKALGARSSWSQETSTSSPKHLDPSWSELCSRIRLLNYLNLEENVTTASWQRWASETLDRQTCKSMHSSRNRILLSITRGMRPSSHGINLTNSVNSITWRAIR